MVERLRRTKARGEKFEGYRSIPSVTEVVLVAQHTRRVEHFARQSDRSWLLRVYRDADVCPLPAAGVELPLAEVYAGVALGS
jgi:Uma2 family endonuclease